MRSVSSLKLNQVNQRKAIHWAKLVTIAGIGQALVQGVGLVSGILIIRLLPTHEYALYTLANSMLGTMTVLADGGIASGVMSEGGKVWKDRDKLGAVISTGLKLRKRFAFFSLLVSIPILFYFLNLHGASPLFNILIILSLIVAFAAALSDSLLEISVKLNQDITRLQKNQVITSLGRLVLITASLFVFPWTFLAILGNGIPRIWGNIRLRKISNEYANNQLPSDPAIEKSILSNVKRILPGSIYYCVSGQITIWLISIFGTTSSVAEIGALSRLAMFLTLVTTVVGTIIEPRFSRLPNDRKLVISKFLQIQLLLALLSGAILLLVWLFPHQILSILGKGYSNLTTEVFLLATSSCFGMISGSIHRLSSSRGVVPRPQYFIPLILTIQVVVGLMVDFSQVKGALQFSIFTAMAASFYRVLFFIRYTKKNSRDLHVNEMSRVNKIKA